MTAMERTDMQTLADRPPATADKDVPAAFAFEHIHKTFRSKDGGTVTALHDVGFSVRNDALTGQYCEEMSRLASRMRANSSGVMAHDAAG